MSEATVRILRILLQCGMIAREAQEIVRGLIRDPPASGGAPAPGVSKATQVSRAVPATDAARLTPAVGAAEPVQLELAQLDPMRRGWGA